MYRRPDDGCVVPCGGECIRKRAQKTDAVASLLESRGSTRVKAVSAKAVTTRNSQTAGTLACVHLCDASGGKRTSMQETGSLPRSVCWPKLSVLPMVAGSTFQRERERRERVKHIHVHTQADCMMVLSDLQ